MTNRLTRRVGGWLLLLALSVPAGAAGQVIPSPPAGGGGAIPQPLDVTDAPTFAGQTLTGSQAFEADDLGSTLVTNGTFTGAATGWTLGAGWAYGANAVTHTPGSTATLAQNPLGGGALIGGRTYKVSIEQTAGTAGSATVFIGGTEASFIVDGSGGAVTYTAFVVATSTAGLILTPDTDYDGTIDNISVQLVPEYLAMAWNLPYAVTGTQNVRLAAIVDGDGLGLLALQFGNDAGTSWASHYFYGPSSLEIFPPTNQNAFFGLVSTGAGEATQAMTTDGGSFSQTLSDAGNVITDFAGGSASFEGAPFYDFDAGVSAPTFDVIEAITLESGGALRAEAADAATVVFQARDIDGAAWSTFATLTSADAPSFVIAPPAGGTVTLSGQHNAADGTVGVTGVCAGFPTVENGIVTGCTGI